MSIWALADLHLSLGVPDKTMEIFGSEWRNYILRIKENWEDKVRSNDLVLIAGDISWAMKIAEVQKDFEWLDKLPGKKLIIKGNHDYWWNSFSKVKKILPPSIEALQNSALLWNDIAFGGARLWDTSEYNFNKFINIKVNPKAKEERKIQTDLQEKVFERELHRLKISLAQMSEGASYRIVMTHYPPIGADLAPSRVSALLEEYDIDVCVFGHLHSIKPNSLPFGEARKVKYVLTSADYVQFHPVQIL